MKLRYTLAALAVSSTVAHGATTLHNLAGSVNNQANFAATAAFTFTTNGLNGGLDTNLASIDIGSSAAGPYRSHTLAIFADTDNSAATYDPTGFALGVSSVGTFATATIPTFSFSGLTLVPNTTYIAEFRDADGTTVSPTVRFGLVNGATDSGTTIFQNAGAPAFATSHEAGITVNMNAIPEPSAAALFGLASLGFILRRRR